MPKMPEIAIRIRRTNANASYYNISKRDRFPRDKSYSLHFVIHYRGYSWYFNLPIPLSDYNTYLNSLTDDSLIITCLTKGILQCLSTPSLFDN